MQNSTILWEYSEEIGWYEVPLSEIVKNRIICGIKCRYPPHILKKSCFSTYIVLV